MKKVSIVIPTYNCGIYIERCLNSIIDNDCSRIEVIIVDDGSTDNSFEIIKKFLDKHKFIKYFKIENSGPSVARNYGLNLVDTEYFTFIDSDDFISKNYFKKIYQLIDSTNADLIHFNKSFRLDQYGNKFVISDSIKEGYVNNIYEDYSRYLISKIKSDKYNEYNVSICKNVFKTSILKNNNIGFTKKRIYYAEDRIFMLSYLKYTKSMYVCNDGYYNYFYRSDSLMNSYDLGRINKILDSYDELCTQIYKLYPTDEVLIRLESYFMSRVIYLIKGEIVQKLDDNKIISDINLLLPKMNQTSFNNFNFKNKLYLKNIYKKNLKILKLLIIFDQSLLKIKNFIKGVIQ